MVVRRAMNGLSWRWTNPGAGQSAIVLRSCNRNAVGMDKVLEISNYMMDVFLFCVLGYCLWAWYTSSHDDPNSPSFAVQLLSPSALLRIDGARSAIHLPSEKDKPAAPAKTRLLNRPNHLSEPPIASRARLCPRNLISQTPCTQVSLPSGPQPDNLLRYSRLARALGGSAPIPI